MTSFQGRVFVGTTRNIFQLVKIAPDPSTDAFHLWPVRVPTGLDAAGMDQRCQIWRYEPQSADWTMAFESPRVPNLDGEGTVWRDFGYRNMVVEQTRSDRDPALYVTTMSSSKSPGALILRSVDGETFEPVTEPGMGDSSASSFRAFVGFRGRLFASPAGRGRLWAFSNSVVLESRDPLARDWRPINEPNFGDPSNVGVFEMGVLGDHLYAGVGNPFTGFQLWKTDAEGEPPYRWTRVIDRGAGRGKLNQAVMSMCAFDGALYVGTGIRRGGYDREFQIGPAAGEILRVFPDDSWELVMGDERSLDGETLEPASGFSPGFDNAFNGYIWCMAEHQGNLYVGTYNSSIFLWWIDPQRVRPETHRRLRRLPLDRVVEREAGFKLWRTPDGIHWFEVSGDGFGNAYNYGVRTLHGCPSGLYVGTANPFGPEVAVHSAAGWTYAPNPRGGLEVWVGRVPGDDRHPEPSPYEGSPVVTTSATEGPRVEGETGGSAGRVDDDHSAPLEDPLLGPAEHWSFSRFDNQGLWTDSTKSHRQAGENLVDTLLGFLPERTGTVLDAGCGSGATSEYLARTFGPGNVVGIDVSPARIESCRHLTPDGTFQVMSATQLEFADATFDHVVCIESAARFRTRDRFLAEAWRVLKPGGFLLLADELFSREVHEKIPLYHARNYVEGPAAYRRLLDRHGFEVTLVRDATADCLLRGSEHFLAFTLEKLNAGELDPQVSMAGTGVRLAYILGLRYYVLAAARRPLAAPRPAPTTEPAGEKSEEEGTNE